MMTTAIADRCTDSSLNQRLRRVQQRSSGWVELVAAVQGDPEAWHEEVSQEVEPEERREGGVALVIVVEEHPEVEEASLEAGELREVQTQPLEAVVMAEDEVRLQEGLKHTAHCTWHSSNRRKRGISRRYGVSKTQAKGATVLGLVGITVMATG